MRISRRSGAPFAAPKAAGVAHPIDAHRVWLCNSAPLRELRQRQTQRGRPGVGDDHVIGTEEVRPARVESVSGDRVLATAHDRPQRLRLDSRRLSTFGDTRRQFCEDVGDLHVAVHPGPDGGAVMVDGDDLGRVQLDGAPGNVAVGQHGADHHHHVAGLDESPHRLAHQPPDVHADVVGVVFSQHRLVGEHRRKR